MQLFISESIILKSLIKLFHFLKDGFSNSFLINTIKKPINGLVDIFRNSMLVSFLIRNDSTRDIWAQSFIFRFVSLIVETPEKVIAWLISKIQTWLFNSIFCRWMISVIKNLHMLIAMTLVVFIITPIDLPWKNQYATIIVLILLALVILRPAFTHEKGIDITGISPFFIVFFACVIISQAFSLSTDRSLKFFIFYVNCFVLVTLIISIIKNTQQLKTVIEVMLIATTITALYGISQAITGVQLSLSQVDIKANPDLTFRIYSVLNNPNDYAEMLIMLIPFYFGAFMYSTTWRKKWLFLILSLPSLIALVLTFSRSSWIGFAVSAIVFMFFVKKKLIVPFILIALVCSIFLPDVITDRLHSIVSGDSSSNYRVLILNTVAPVIRDFWYTGIGLGTDTFKVILTQYDLSLLNYFMPPHSHNLLVQIWIETGIIGILSFCGFLVNYIKSALRNIINVPNIAIKYIILAVSSSLCGIIVTGLGEYIWFTHRVMLIFWAILGLGIATLNQINEENKLKAIKESSA